MKLQPKTKEALTKISFMADNAGGSLTKEAMVTGTGLAKQAIDSLVNRQYLEPVADRIESKSPAGRPSKVKKYKVTQLAKDLITA